MLKQSAGILVYRQNPNKLEVLLTHPAGPFWAKKDTWSIPKGEADQGEDLLAAAKREFAEETGFKGPSGEFHDLGQSKQSASKVNYIWAIEGDVDIEKFVCNSTFTMEWPPKSGQQQTFPENDRAKWFSLGNAKKKLFKAQILFIDRLAEYLNINIPETESEQQEPPPQQGTLF